jgi:hypothetical protein
LSKNDIGLQADEFFRTCRHLADRNPEPIIRKKIVPLAPSTLFKSLAEGCQISFKLRIVCAKGHQHAEVFNSAGRLLRARRDRPCSRATDQIDELASLHSTISSSVIETG